MCCWSLRLGSRRERGFTLVELMAVVMIVGILAVIGIMLVRQHMKAASTHEAVAGLQKLRGLEESFLAQNGNYLNVSRTPGPIWYPAATPGRNTYSWTQSGPDSQFWRQLGASSFTDTRFGFAVNAGLAGEAFPVILTPAFTAPATPPTEPWYCIQVRGQRDATGDAKQMTGVTTSLGSNVYVDVDTE